MKQYEELTNQEIQILKQQGILNGFWPRNSPFLRWILKKLTPAFNEVCPNFHDFSYFRGTTEQDRKRADDWFLKYMLKDCQRLTWFTRAYYVCWAYIYHKAVRLFGWKFFNYK